MLVIIYILAIARILIIHHLYQQVDSRIQINQADLGGTAPPQFHSQFIIWSMGATIFQNAVPLSCMGGECL